MTIENTTRRKTVVPNGNAGPHAFPFRLLQVSDMEAYSVDPLVGTPVLLSRGSGPGQYQVNINTITEGGSVTLGVDLAATFTTGIQLLMARNVDDKQVTKIPVSSPFPEKAVENALDKLTMRDIEIEDALTRAITLPLSAPEDFNGQVPGIVPLRGFKVSADGKSIILTDFDPDSGGVSDDILAQMQTILEQVQAAASAAVRPGFIHAAAYGVVSSSSVDNTTALQTAMAALPAGGTLSLENLQPRFNSQISFSTPIMLYGGEKMPFRESSNSSGSAVNGNVNAIGAVNSRPRPLVQCGYTYGQPSRAQFMMNFRTGMKNLYFSDPLQNNNTGGVPVDSGPIVSLAGGATHILDGLMFNNCFRWIEGGVAGGGAGSIITNIFGTPLGLCINFPKAADVVKLSNVHAWPYWQQGPANSAFELAAQMNSILIQLGDVDDMQLSNISGYKCGTLLKLVDNGTGTPWFQADNLLGDKVLYAIKAEAIDNGIVSNLIATGRDPAPKLQCEAMVQIDSTVGQNAVFTLRNYQFYNGMNGLRVDATGGFYTLEVKRKLKIASNGSVASLFQPDGVTGYCLISTNEANIHAKIDDPYPFNCFVGSGLWLNGVRFPKKGSDITPAGISDRANWNAETDMVNLMELPVTGVTGTFTKGQTITGGTSAATGTVTRTTPTGIVIKSYTGTFTNGETVTTGTGSATASTAGIVTGVSVNMRSATRKTVLSNLAAFNDLAQEGGPYYLQARIFRNYVGTTTDSNASFSLQIQDSRTGYGTSLEHMQNQYYQNWTIDTKLIMPFVLNGDGTHNMAVIFGQQDDGVDDMEILDIRVFRMPRVEYTFSSANEFLNTSGFNINDTVQALVGSSFYKDPTKQGAPMRFDGQSKVHRITATPSKGTWWRGDKAETPGVSASSFIGKVCTQSGTFGTLTGITNTVSITASAKTVTLSDASGLKVDDWITCGTAYPTTAPARILRIVGNVVTTHIAAATSQASGTSVAYSTPVFKDYAATAA